MKVSQINLRRRSGFTLIEMIGVLAIIAVLAALLIPRIFNAVNESRVNGAALSYNSFKSAAITYFGKYGRFGDFQGTAFTGTQLTNSVTDWDSTALLKAGYLEKGFETKLGDGSDAVVGGCNVAADAAITGTNRAWDLDGSSADGSAGNDVTGSAVLWVKLTNVAEDDARELSKKVDGDTLSTTSSSDLKGRVKYAAASNGLTDVYLYVAHK